MTETPVLGSLDPAAPNPFGPEDTIRAVVGEPVMAALYPRALVMDVAHPSVAAAVSDHSAFRERPLARLWATSDAAVRIVFGAEQEPMAAVRQIYRFHDHINGRVGAGSYTAHDASLLLWVWATLVDTCDVAFKRWVRPYQPGEADAFYRDMCAFARFFGIPLDLVPPDRAAFAAYLDQMLSGDELAQGATSARLARDILWFRRWFVAPRAMSALRVLAIGTLDPRLAQHLGVALSPEEQQRFRRLDDGLRRHYRRLPAARIMLPYAYLRLRRTAARLHQLGGVPRAVEGDHGAHGHVGHR